MIKRSHRYPFQTHYERPKERKFYIWRCRVTSYRPGHSSWRWCCMLCEPPTYGYRTVLDGWRKIVEESMPRHFASHYYHHDYVQRTRPIP